jgi:hypothetical protein
VSRISGGSLSDPKILSGSHPSDQGFHGSHVVRADAPCPLERTPAFTGRLSATAAWLYVPYLLRLFVCGFDYGSFSSRDLAVLPNSIRLVCCGVDPVGAPVPASTHHRLSGSARRCEGYVLRKAEVACALHWAELTLARGANSTCPVQLMISAVRIPSGTPSTRNSLIVRPAKLLIGNSLPCSNVVPTPVGPQVAPGGRRGQGPLGREFVSRACGAI